MIEATVGSAPSVLLLGPVRGLVDDALQVADALVGFAAEALGIAVSPEELRSLVAYFGDAAAEPAVPLSSSEIAEVRGLVRFGEVTVPNPSVLAALGFGRERGAPVAPLDPSDDGAAEMFTDHIGYFELVRRTVRENRLARSPPSPSTADEFALAWDRELAGGRGSRRYAEARNTHVAEGARTLGSGRRRIAVVVDRERFDGVRAALAGAART